jgi:hypothetical protein
MVLSSYESEQLKKVQAHRDRELRRSARRLVPEALQDKGRDYYDKALKMPGAAKVRDRGAAVLKATAQGAGKFITRTGQLTTSEKRVVRAYAKRGHPVQDVADVRKLDLSVVDKVASFTRLHYAYSASAAVEGATAGLIVSGGQILAAGGAVAGAGAGSAPGLGTIAAAMGVDAGALLTVCSRVIAHDALYYGYDPRDPAEEVFMMQVIGLGLAATPSAKYVAYQQLSVLTTKLAKNATWHQLNQQALVRVAQKFAGQFSQKLTKKKLGQFVPVAGIGIGAALNWKMVDDVSNAAYWAYRQRFLYEKGGELPPPFVDADLAQPAEDENETAINVIEILESEGIDLEEG